MNLIQFGDCRRILTVWAQFGLKAQTCITSPPYYGLRDYGHEGQIGQEETPPEFIANLVEVFRCVRDVLADDGTLWLNMGDSYAGRPNGPAASTYANLHGERAAKYRDEHAQRSSGVPEGLKHKDLMGIPWALAFALRADGWHLRQDIIWHKPNPMPESVRDRCTKAHEYLFLLSKGPRYYFDGDAMQEPVVSAPSDLARARILGRGKQAASAAYLGSAQRDKSGGFPVRDLQNPTRNRRSVWTVATRPYKGAHFATFPPALIEPCVLAGSRPGDVVLDPFMGSGTTAAVALKHGRQYLGCELNREYAPLQDARLAAVDSPAAPQ